jgi:hypothetical protein
LWRLPSPHDAKPAREQEPPSLRAETQSVPVNQTIEGWGIMASVVSTTRSPRARPRSRIRAWIVAITAALLLTSSGVAVGGVAARSRLGNPDVIANWNLVAQAALLGDTTKKPQEHFLYLAFLNIAMYDAVVGIHGRYQPYALHARAQGRTSDEAAVAAAAHHVLETYTPYAQATLDSAYATALASIPDGRAKTRGIAFGMRAANKIIALRVNDGRNAAITFDKPPAPGVWRPTPPANLAMFVPWMGSVKPLVVRSGTQFGEPGPPPAMTSTQYTADFNEVKSMGGNAATGSNRTDAQYTGALIDQAATRNMDIVDTARMFAAVNTSIADALIGVWHAKLLYGFWRPITAINLADTDGNPNTDVNASWVPLLTNPPYPDYVSGYSGVTGAFTRSLQKTLGTSDLDVTLHSTAVVGAERRYDRAGALNNAVIDARIWLGIHFRFADTAGVTMGQRTASWVLNHAFQPVGR